MFCYHFLPKTRETTRRMVIRRKNGPTNAGCGHPAYNLDASRSINICGFLITIGQCAYWNASDMETTGRIAMDALSFRPGASTRRSSTDQGLYPVGASIPAAHFKRMKKPSVSDFLAPPAKRRGGGILYTHTNERQIFASAFCLFLLFHSGILSIMLILSVLTRLSAGIAIDALVLANDVAHGFEQWAGELGGSWKRHWTG